MSKRRAGRQKMSDLPLLLHKRQKTSGSAMGDGFILDYSMTVLVEPHFPTKRADQSLARSNA